MHLAPIEKLRDAVDLVIVTSVRKSQNLVQEVTEPRRIIGQMNLPCFKERALGSHAVALVAFRLDANRQRSGLQNKP
jgi:hypothetical protein